MKNQPNIKHIADQIAEINNLLMEVSVKGDDVFRLSQAMHMCVDLFMELRSKIDTSGDTDE